MVCPPSLTLTQPLPYLGGRLWVNYIEFRQITLYLAEHRREPHSTFPWGVGRPFLYSSGRNSASAHRHPSFHLPAMFSSWALSLQEGDLKSPPVLLCGIPEPQSPDG